MAWFVPAALTAWAVSYQAGRPGPWRDELATWSAASRSVPQIIALGRHIDGVTVPYYVLIHMWIGWFGDAPLTMRLPSLFAAVATTVVVALLGRRFWGTPSGLLAGLLTAVLPITSRYGQEARGYQLATLFAALATLVLTGALERPRWWRWIFYGLCILLAGLAHLISLLILAGHLVWTLVVAITERRWRVLWWVPAATLAAAAVVGLVHDGLDERGVQLNWLEQATPVTLTQLPQMLFGDAITGGAVVALAVFALTRRPARPAVLFWVTVLLPVVLLYAYDQLVTPLFVGRYLLFTVPLLSALAGAGLRLLRLPLALVTVAVIGLIGLPVQAMNRSEHSPYDYGAAAAVVAGNERPGDGVIYEPRDDWQMVDLGLEYHLRGRAPRDVLLARDEVQNASLWATRCTDPALCLNSTMRVWVVAADNLDPAYRASSTNQLTYAEQTALHSFVPMITWRVEGFTITLFDRPPAA